MHSLQCLLIECDACSVESHLRVSDDVIDNVQDDEAAATHGGQ